jgi:hypothetical protein
MMAAGHHRTPIVFQENRTAISPGTRTGMNNKIKRAGAACKQLSAVDYVWCCVVLCVCFFVDAVDAVDAVDVVDVVDVVGITLCCINLELSWAISGLCWAILELC